MNFNEKKNPFFLLTRCLLLLIEKEESRLQHNSKLITRTIPEIVMSFNQPGKKPNENIALKLLLKIASVFSVSLIISSKFIVQFR